MPLPVGFRVHGTRTGVSGCPAPPRAKKVMGILDKTTFGELLTSTEISLQAGQSVGGAWTSHPAVSEYREKVDGKLFWGSRKTIAKLRKQLAEPEETNDQD